jgi:L-ascorbate metabolism protein UlaG (beta-lactamase superfamily)
MPKFPLSDHCDGERFFNPLENARPLADVIKWSRTRQRTAWPASLPLNPHPAPPAAVEPGAVAVTFIGHSTFLIRTATMVMITDPVFTSRAGPFGRLGPRRVRPPAIAPSALPPMDLVLVSHNHYDHLQPYSLRLFADLASYVAPLGVGLQLNLAGAGEWAYARAAMSRERRAATALGPATFQDPGQLHELDWWQSTTVADADITCVPAQHFSARTLWDRNRTLWCGYVVRTGGLTMYFAGDSGYGPHFKAIGARFPSIDVALLPIGAYEPRWFMKPVHMNPDEAIRAHLDLGARRSIGMHFGTFQLTDEAIDEPLRALERAREAHGVGADEFGVLDFGETAVADFTTSQLRNSATPQ